MSLVRCPFPNCVLEEHETGEHRLGRPEKPWGTLRVLETLTGMYANSPRCDLEPEIAHHDRAQGFYVDQLGFGWALCVKCATKHLPTFTAETQPSAGEPAGTPSPRPAPTLASSAGAARSVVIPFNRRVR